MSSEKAGFADSLMTAVKDNPMAAALIGGGLLWLMTGDDKMRTAARSFTAAVSPAMDAGAKAAQSAATVVERSPPTAPGLDDDARSGISSAMSGAAEKVKDRVNDGVAYAQETLGRAADPSAGKQAYEKAQSSLADVLERQPLLLGAVGVAIGAAVAGAIRVTELENEAMGKFSSDLKEDIGTRSGAVVQSLQEASDTLKSEFADIGAEALDRGKQAGLGAIDAARGATNPSR
jgi:hypothetical protein